MIYLICQDWSNTSNNHAGMKYLCNRLQEKYPNRYKSIVIDDYRQGCPVNLVKRKIHFYLAMRSHKHRLKEILKQLFSLLQKGDKVFLMEYMEKLTPQLYLAKELKQCFPIIPVYGLVHLVPGKLDSFFSKAEIEEWTSHVDKIVTFGSSL